MERTVKVERAAIMRRNGEERRGRVSRSCRGVVCRVFRAEADGCSIATHCPQIEGWERNEIQRAKRESCKGR